MAAERDSRNAGTRRDDAFIMDESFFRKGEPRTLSQIRGRGSLKALTAQCPELGIPAQYSPESRARALWRGGGRERLDQLVGGAPVEVGRNLFEGGGQD